MRSFFSVARRSVGRSAGGFSSAGTGWAIGAGEAPPSALATGPPST